MIEHILGFIYNFCFVSCYWPQIIKSWRTKSVEDVSVSLFIISVIGYIAAAGYAISKFGFDFWLLFNYTFSGISAIIMVMIYCKYRNK